MKRNLWHENYRNELFNYENKQDLRMVWGKEKQSTQNLYLIKIFTGLCFAVLFQKQRVGK